ncbi:DUF4174 domain-containing protein [Hymenobacter sp. 102]|uniref:DUF4174 domain-containing protein n=1 Tax=Hymenobacter sp. 102 TaxID=3403152 RepID=UPI003CF3C37C
MKQLLVSKAKPLSSYRWLWLMLVVAASGPGAAQQPASALETTIRASKWQKRLLLLCAPGPEDARLTRQRQLLTPVQPGLAARDMLVREVIFSQLAAPDQRYLRERLGVKTTDFVLLLIGKDGGVKRRETAPVPAAQLFSTVDAMPMRQREMRGPR